MNSLKSVNRNRNIVASVIAAPFLWAWMSCIHATTMPNSQVPAMDTDGTTHIPAFSMPQSGYLSEPAKKAIIELEAMHRKTIWPINIAENRKLWDEEFLKPQLRRMRAVFPVTITPAVLGGIQTDIVEPEKGVDRKNQNRILINVHGGSFVAGARYGGQAESIPIASLSGIKVVAVDYRLAPEHQFPAASEDVTSVYKALLKKYRPENIGIYGCSAGGMITAELMPWFQTHDLPRPGAVGIFCAGAIASEAGDSSFIGTLLDWRQTPPFVSSSPHGAAILDMYFGDRDVKDAATSPAYSPSILKRFPPTLLITGTRDAQMSNAVYTHTQLIKAGVDAELHVWEGMGHGFFAQPVSNLIDVDMPETREAWNVIVKFFSTHLGRK